MKIAATRMTALYLTPAIFVAGAIVAVSPAAAEGFGGANHCARYGADFVAVAGSNACTRVVGHVRVDIARGPSAPMNYAAPQDGVRPASQTTHVRAGDAAAGLIDLFPR